MLFAFTAFAAANLYFIYKGVANADPFISWKVEETIVFILLQLIVAVIYMIRPLTKKSSKVIYWCVSETLVLLTVFFWGVWIVGPIWLK